MPAMSGYPHADIERKWQEYWDRHKTFRAVEDHSVPRDRRAYVLDMFPYPSAAGLHVGHPEGYIATDIYSRYLRMQGYAVLHPMGFVSFGLPAENYAIKTGVHPRASTEANIERFTKQIKSFGFSYDWDRVISTHLPEYYRWTQWIFLKLWERGLAYEDEAPINWCPSCLTGLANEEVKDGLCERCGHPVTRRAIRQWILRITAYAERLLADLDKLQWSDSLKLMQRNWIGRSEGANVVFKLAKGDGEIEVYTTRPDTLFGATFMVLAPEHPLVPALTRPAQRAAVEAYREAAARKSDLQRAELQKEKTGVFTGSHAVNPVNGARLPIWIADYVMMGYGTGAIMAVPGHDQRDWEFARAFDLPVVEVVSGGDVAREAFVEIERGRMVNSSTPDGSLSLDGLTPDEAIRRMTEWLERTGKGRAAVNYKLRDWLFSRQRYWGEPFPIVWVDGAPRALPEELLPVRLPDTKDFRPRGTGERPQSPLAGLTDWVHTTEPGSGRPALRETNTMPQWAGSCWYYLRFLDPKNDRLPVDPARERYWMPVDLYIGGAEHAVLHLLYARFWHKVLYDIGVVSTPEPFPRLVHPGIILGEDNQKMSKRWDNVVNPDQVIDEYGADALRLFEMFMGPLEAMKPWSTKGVEGLARFLDRVWRLVVEEDDRPSAALTADAPDPPTARLMHQTVRKVTEDVEALKFNTAIAQMMVFVNELTRLERRPRAAVEALVLVLAPFAPHIAEELWQRLGHEPSLARAPWPTWDPALVLEQTVTVAVQVNGKLRGTLELARGTARDEALEAARADERIRRHLEGQAIRKVIHVPDKLLNLVVGPA